MKAPLIALLTVAVVAATQAQEPPRDPKLLGIISVAGNKRAVLEVPKSGNRIAHSLLGEGERDENVGVIEILPEKGMVKVRVKTTDPELALKLDESANQISSSGLTVDLREADLNSVLSLYGEWTKKTLLRWPSLPDAKFSSRGSPGDQIEAAKLLESALSAENIVVIPDGDKFLMVVPKDKAGAAQPHSSELKSSESAASSKEAMLEPGTINFMGADIVQVLAVYADFQGGDLDRNSIRSIRGKPVYLRTQTALSKAECRYALETVFAWQNLKLVPAAPGFVKAVPLSESKSP